MSIFILEDDVIQAQSLKQSIEEICLAQHIPYDFIEATSRYEHIISKVPACTYLPIYFLDIEIKNEERKGLEVAQEIRKVDPHGIIVFVTTHSELASISYQYMVSALTFIEKDLSRPERLQKIEACLQHYVQKNKVEHKEDYFFVENVHTTVKVPFHTIEYIMTDEPHRLKLITTNQFIQLYGSLKEIEQIDSRLIRCHQSYVVNEQQIQGLDVAGQHVILKSGKQVPVSRRMMKKMKVRLKDR
ncbi:LytR/AlgR family response regulator transcription factor [Paenibacillus septentrionalis]|uniref:LytR/AlgR family response regulator transcription factor n=1 Tax=Paenibacillus septentrionalis TaxID=429342 RepID=A0ABW1V2C7_9BACL